MICSSEILARPWCVGEMTAARLHGVDNILVILPDFTWPTDDFTTNYASHVPGVFGLAKFGISVSMAQETLSWLKFRPRMLLPKKLSLSVSDAVAGKLVSRKKGFREFSTQHGVETTELPSEVVPEEAGRPRHNIVRNISRLSVPRLRSGCVQSFAEHVVQQLTDPCPMSSCKVAAIADRGNWDGVCVALQVREMLVPHLSTDLEKVPCVLTEEESLPFETQCALIICTNGCFHSASFARQVLEAEETGVRFIPVVAEENFRFPTETFYEDVREWAPSLLKAQMHRHTQEQRTAEDLVTAIETIFREIAIHVVLQDSEDIIAVRVLAVAGRLQETRSGTPRGIRQQASGVGTKLHTSSSSRTIRLDTQHPGTEGTEQTTV